MLTERQEATNGIDKLIGILSNDGLPISDADRSEKLQQLEQGRIIVQNKKYHVTTLGIFSTGKSTLINSMIGGNYLPAADHPTTARITEIRPSEKAFIIFQTENTPSEKEQDVAKKFLSALGYTTGKSGNIQILTKMILDPADTNSEVVKGIVITGTSAYALKAADIQKILTFLGTETNKAEENVGKLVDQLKNIFKDIIIGLPVDEWMSDIVLTDAPGTGSVVDSHEKVINKIIPESQLVLHIVDAERIGDSTDRDFAERIANFQHRKIFYIMNKIDRMSSEGCDDAEIKLKKTFPAKTTEDCAPEIIRVSALSALLAMDLKAGRISIDDIMNNRKLSLGYLWADEKFRNGSKDIQKKILVEELWKNSNFEEFQDRVATYLRKENKEMAIVEDAWKLVFGLAADIKSALDESLKVLLSDTKISDLEKEKNENENKRKELKKAADRALGEYKIEIEGGVSEATGKIYDGIADDIKESLKDSQTKIEIDLRKWLNSHYESISKNPKEMTLYIQRAIENAISKARNVAESQATTAVANLKTELVDILREARDLSLIPGNGSNKTENPDVDTSIALLGSGIVGGGTAAGAATGAGIGAAIGSVVPGAGTALGAGIGAGVGALAGLISGGIYLGKKGKELRIDKIVEQVNQSVQKIFFDGGKLTDEKNAREVTPYFGILQRDLTTQCNRFRDDLQKKISQRFAELNQRDEELLREIASSKEHREELVKKYTDLSEQCKLLIKRS